MGETDRDIGRLEARVDNLESWMRSIDEKVDQLLAAANMGKGAWWAVLKVGGLIMLVCMAFAWAVDHLPKWVR